MKLPSTGKNASGMIIPDLWSDNVAGNDCWGSVWTWPHSMASSSLIKKGSPELLFSIHHSASDICSCAALFFWQPRFSISILKLLLRSPPDLADYRDLGMAGGKGHTHRNKRTGINHNMEFLGLLHYRINCLPLRLNGLGNFSGNLRNVSWSTYAGFISGIILTIF
jgi:hypothetical protein